MARRTLRDRLEEHPRGQAARRRLDAFLATPLGRLAWAMYEVRLRDRALTLAGQAFIALVPLLVVIASWLGSTGGEALGDYLVRSFELEGDTADAVHTLFSRPPDASSGTSVLSLAILLVSVSSFGRALQRTYEVAWGLPARGRSRAVRGALGTLMLLATMAGVIWVHSLVGGWPAGAVLVVPVQLAVAIPGWWLLTRLLLNLRVGWWSTLPGAVVSAVAQVLTGWAGAVWVPRLIEHHSERYGVVGVAVALVSWLVVIGFVTVAAAVFGAWASSGLATYTGRWSRPQPSAGRVEP